MNREEKQSLSAAYTVSSLTAEIKSLLENTYPFVRIQGEISNLSRPSSGHLYFTLKDNRSQVSAIVFKGVSNHLKFRIENGLQIHGIARLSVYEPRGTYQLIFEFMEPKGTGALQLAFEQLKERLSREGLFDSRHKKIIPKYPERISVVTSPTGAVIHDIITIISRRFPSVILEVVPVKVQGDLAESDLCSALDMLNRRGLSDVVIIARGGGSLEDLAAFNSERLARSVVASSIPVVSAVGHETDYTICDFVSDLRAPTPSAAAELVTPLMSELVSHVNQKKDSMVSRMVSRIDNHRNRVQLLCGKLKDPKRKIIDWRLRLDDNVQRLIRTMQKKIIHKREMLAWRLEKLEALSPYAILDRGYSVTRSLPDERIITDTNDLMNGQEIEIILSHGRLHAGVKRIMEHGEKKF